MKSGCLLLVAVAALVVTAVIVPSTSGAQPTAASPVSGTFTSVSAARVFDSRTTNPVRGGERRTLQVTGRAGLPDAGVGAVLVNVTATRASLPGYLSVVGGTPASIVGSTVNYVPGVDVANLAVVDLRGGDLLTVVNGQVGGAQVDIIVDVVGWYSAGHAAAPGSYAPVTPTRVLDTRDGTGARPGTVGAGATVQLPVTGRNGVPTAAGVAAVVVNVTATGEGGAGNVRVHATSATTATTSNLNFVAGRDVANLVTVPVGPDGVVSLTVSGAATQLVADLAGYVLSGNTVAGGSQNLVTAERIADTRLGLGVAAGPVGSNGVVSVPVAGRGGVPSSGVAAVVLTVTAAEPTAAGHVTAFPHGSPVPNTSNLNFTAGIDVGNIVVVPVGNDGRVDLLNVTAGPRTQLVVDVTGWIRSTPPADVAPGDPHVSGAFANLGEARLTDSVATMLQPKWRAGNGDFRDPSGYRVATNAGVTYAQNVPAQGQLSALDTQTGRVLWTRPSRNGSLVVSASAVYTAEITDTSGTYRFTALDKSDGSVLWTADVAAGTAHFDDFVLSGGRLVYVTTDDQSRTTLTVVTLDAAQGTDARLTTIGVASDGQRFFFGTADGRMFVSGAVSGLRAFDLTNGSLLWSDPAASQGQVRPVAGRLYVDSSGAVASYDPSGCGAATCPPAWTTPLHTEVPSPGAPIDYGPAAITSNMLAIQASSSTPGFNVRIYYYSAATGELLDTTVLPGQTNPQPPVITPGLVWTVVSNSLVVLPDTCPGACRPLRTYTFSSDIVQPYLQIAGGSVLLLDVNTNSSAITALR